MGTLITLKAGTGTNIAPSFYFPYAIGGVSGASEYRWNIGNCNTTMMGFGDLLHGRARQHGRARRARAWTI